MKSILLALALVTPAFAVHFDIDAFGGYLNGWDKSNTSTYAFTDAHYKTYSPTITGTPSGGLYVSTQVDLLAFGGQGAISHIDLTFNSSGTLVSAQLRSTIGRKIIDTGLINRAEEPVATAPVEGQPAPKPPVFNQTEQLINELFNRYDAEMRKVTEGKDAEKRDLFSRFSNKNAKTANLAAGLRHNVNLMLASTRR
ncbi:MAG: hypothetical protein NWT08_06825 [Akkermansiaceae bacterium]|jgi:hypothetical protein|nr:hypothetical protein [Akkermansiaceae bacterium]MDP4647376.1 hypothetical protein [Akkermansiaceae bacterium]MDP4720966.1 hypothetical protein [Akkermansiaceae bacterium]MDP4779528.1 hypothetical protein [Akkermansiaceae bacterium]MDP4847346.1 hypothetical protein [Akkermansiaceae bacterium]